VRAPISRAAPATSTLISTLLFMLFIAAPAFAANTDADAVSVAQTAEGADAERPHTDGDDRQKGKDARRQPRVGDDLDSCRRDADGMRGPERSRFMTQCLKERK
jgi:hypothetical protein